MGEPDKRPDDPESYWIVGKHQLPLRVERRDAIGAVYASLRRFYWVALAVGLVLLVGVVVPRTLRVRQFRASAEAAVQALDAVASAVEVGGPYTDYGKRVADANVVVDQFLRRWPADLAPPLRGTIADVMDDFGLALDAWAQRVKGDAWTSADDTLGRRLASVPGVETDKYGVHLNTARQLVWVRALRNLSGAREMLGQQSKAADRTFRVSLTERELDRIKRGAERHEALIRRCESKAALAARRAEARWWKDEARKHSPAGPAVLRESARAYGEREGIQEFNRCLTRGGD